MHCSAVPMRLDVAGEECRAEGPLVGLAVIGFQVYMGSGSSTCMGSSCRNRSCTSMIDPCGQLASCFCGRFMILTGLIDSTTTNA